MSVNILIKFGFACSLLCFADVIAAEPKIESITPSVLRSGDLGECKIIGEGLTSLYDVVFYDPCVDCTNIRIENDFEATVTLQVQSSCEVEILPFRLLTRDGFSNLKVVRLVQEPLLIEPDRINLETSIPITERPGMAIYGTLNRGEYDRYSIALKEGERFTAIVEAMRLGGILLDTAMKVTSPTGALIADVDDTALTKQDPYLTFIAEETGEYTVEVRESNYDGSEDSHYLLFLGTFPSPAIIFPPGGEAGKVLDAVTINESRPDTKVVDLQIGPLEARKDGWYPYRIQTDRQASPAMVNLRSATYPNVTETEPNDSREAVSDEPHSIPAAFCGIIDKPGDIDFYPLHVNAGEELLFEVFADRIGSPIDSLLSIYDSHGDLLIHGDDWTSQDSRFYYRFSESGTYFLSVKDKLSNGWPYGIYRVEVTELRPTLEAFLPRPVRTSTRGQTISVPRGNRAIAKLAVRRENVVGDAQISFSDLPEGVMISDGLIPEARYWAPVIVTADTDAPIQGTLSNVHAVIESENTRVEGGFTQINDLVAGAADSLFYGIHVDRLAVAVVEPVPFKMHLDLPPSGLPIGGSVGVKVRVEREEGFEDPIIVRFPHLPPWATCEPEATIRRGEVELTHILSITERGDTGKWPFIVTGEIDTKNAAPENARLQGTTVASQLLDLIIVPAPLQGEIDAIAGEQGDTVTLTCRLSRVGESANTLIASLEGLPNRVSCESVVVEQGQEQFQLSIRLMDDAPVGTFKSITCRLNGEVYGYPVSYVVNDHIILQIEEPGKLVRGSSGKLLSPLEALKQSQSKK